MLIVGARIRRLPLSPILLGLLLAAAGLAVWIALSLWAGLADEEPGFRFREAWESDAYLFLGIPIMATSVAVAGFHTARRVWRWPLWLVGGHQAGVLLVGVGMQSALSLAILTLVLAILLAALFTVPALVGSQLARWAMPRLPQLT